MTEPIYMECHDPEVLAEWQGRSESSRVEVHRPSWTWMLSSALTASDFAYWLASNDGWEYRLVFEGPDQAAEALARWVKEGRNVLFQRMWGGEEPSTGSRGLILEILSGRPNAYRIAAEPSPWEPRAGERAVLAGGEQVKILTPAWQVRLPSGGAWFANASDLSPPTPEPATERVPWWECVGRRGPHTDEIVSVGCNEDGPWLSIDPHGRGNFAPAADGTFEVLCGGES